MKGTDDIHLGIYFCFSLAPVSYTHLISEIAVYLRGLEQMMYDMYDHPEELHHLMRFLRDGILAKLDYLEKNNLLCLNNTGNYVGSGGMGYSHQLPQKDFDGSHVRPIDMWGFAESQPTVGVSPALYEERCV